METCDDLPMELYGVFPSQKDDTVKFLFRCRDDNLIEGVLMHYHYGYSLCISTQVGCKMGCAFCASTLNGCVRSLSSGEMLSEVLLANRYLGEKGRVGHIVLMGSGEPLDNYDHTVRFLRAVNEEKGPEPEPAQRVGQYLRSGGSDSPAGGGKSGHYAEPVPARPQRRNSAADHARRPALAFGRGHGRSAGICEENGPPGGL